MQAPPQVRATPGTFVKIELSATSAEHPSWAKPVQVYFRRDDRWLDARRLRAAAGWKVRAARDKMSPSIHFARAAVKSPLTFIGCTLTLPTIFSGESSVPL